MIPRVVIFYRFDCICNITIYVDDTTRYSKCDRHLICGNKFNWLLNLNLIYETLWSDAGSDLLISMLEKLSWFHLTGLITLVLLTWKWIGLVLRKNNLLRFWRWLSLLIWIRALTLYLLLKLSSRKLEPWFVLWSLRFFFLRLLCISMNLPYGHA